MLTIPWLGVSYCCSLCGVFLGVGKECVRSFVPLRRHYHHRTLLQSGTLSPVDVTSLFLLFTASIASIIKVNQNRLTVGSNFSKVSSCWWVFSHHFLCRTTYIFFS